MPRLKEVLIAVAVLSFAHTVPTRAAEAEDACGKMSGAEKSACMESMGKAKGKARGNMSDEMKGLGAKGKGMGREHGQGMATDEAKAAAKSAKDKAKNPPK